MKTGGGNRSNTWKLKAETERQVWFYGLKVYSFQLYTSSGSVRA